MSYLTTTGRSLSLTLSSLILLAACGGGGGGGSTPPPPNLAPSAASAVINTNVGTLASVTPSVTDPNSGDSFTYTIVSVATGGTAGVNGAQLTYMPNAGYNGTDSFTFRATDQGGLSVVGTANVTIVNNAPSAATATLSANMGVLSAAVTPVVTDVDVDTYNIRIRNNTSCSRYGDAR